MVRAIGQGYQKKLPFVTSVYSEIGERLLMFLAKGGFIKGYQIFVLPPTYQRRYIIKKFLIYLRTTMSHHRASSFGADVTSKHQPDVRRKTLTYKSLKKLVRMGGGVACYLINTDKGLMSGSDAVRFNIGGKVLARF